MNEQSAVRGRGRPQGFDRAEVVAKVIDAFWAKGFENTGITDVVAATGLNKSSLYNTFGSKDALFLEALAMYTKQMVGHLTELLLHGDLGLQDMHATVDLQLERIESEDISRGCFTISSGVALARSNDGVRDIAESFRSDARAAYRAALERAVALGEIEASRVDSAVEVCLGMTFAIPTLACNGASKGEMATFVSSQHDFIDNLAIR